MSFALVGGLAVSARTEPRFTRDVDLAISVARDPDAEALVGALIGRGWSVLAQVEQEATKRLATVRLAPPPGGPASRIIVDLLFASSGVEPEVVAEADELEVLAEIVVPVATVADLLALKILAQDIRTRPQDAVDARSLLRVASSSDIEKARSLLSEIEARGFHRGKDLLRELGMLLEEA